MGCGPNEGRGRESETVDGCLCVCVSVHQSVDYQLYMESQRTGPRERERDIERGKKSEKCVCAYVLILKDTLSALGALLSPPRSRKK